MIKNWKSNKNFPNKRLDVLNNPFNVKVYSYEVYTHKIQDIKYVDNLSKKKNHLLICKDLNIMSNAQFGIRTYIFYTTYIVPFCTAANKICCTNQV